MTGRKLDVRVLVTHPQAVPPAKAMPGDAGMDLYAVVEDGPVRIMPGEWAVIGTGLKMAIPEGWEMQVRPRSGLAAKHGVTVLNSPGTIDAGYRGEVKVCLINHGKAPFEIWTGDRIAQGVFSEVPDVGFTQVMSEGDLSESIRGEGGFGSTGSR